MTNAWTTWAVVDDLAAATAFFVELGLKLQGGGSLEGGWVDRVVGLEGVRSEVAILETPDGNAGGDHRLRPRFVALGHGRRRTLIASRWSIAR